MGLMEAPERMVNVWNPLQLRDGREANLAQLRPLIGLARGLHFDI
jgi:hypothetical protein